MQYPPIFHYYKVMPKGGHRCLISPSSLSNLYLNPGEWYNTAVLGNPAKFTGNEATTIGSICHYIYERETFGEEWNIENIREQLTEYAQMRPELELDVPTVMDSAISTAMAVIANYPLNNPGVSVEHSVLAEVGDKIYIGGHVDRIEGNRIVDFKTVAKKPGDKISLGHKLQLMAYVAALNIVAGKQYIDEISIVYGVKPTKTMGARCFVTTEKIEEEHIKLIEYTINYIRCALEKCDKDPSLVPLIFRDFETEKMF